MGNRAVITTGPYSDDNVGIYVHWNGGRASIEGFLQAAEELGFRAPPDPYGIARLTQIIANYFGDDGLSIGVDICENLDTDNGDNGTYLITGWDIKGRHCGLSLDNEEVDPAKTAKIKNDCVKLVRKAKLETA